MRFSSTLLGLASLGSVIAHPTIDEREVISHAMNMPRDRSQNPSPCGVDASPEFVAVMEDMAAAEANGTLPSTPEAAFRTTAAAVVTVPVYFHVVAINTTPSGGYLTAAQLSAQISYMNNAFSSTGYQFTQAGADYTVNTAWANDRSELTMKRALRKGGYNAVNIYFQYFLADNNLGYCYYPSAAGSVSGSTAFYTDGCTVLASSVAGGTLANYNLGGTAAHEVGHWFGLAHTFEGSACSATNDGVADTPAQNGYTSGCPASRDSCPNSPGLDPIHNYMDYSYDVCYSEFTPGQVVRLTNMYNTYRA